MKDLSIYFREVDTEIKSKEGTIGESIGIYTQGHFPELKKNSVAIIYVPEFRNGEENIQNKQNENFREFFYELYVGTDWNKKIFDCGTILPGKEISDTYFALTQVVSEMIKNDIIPIIIGGTQDLTYSIYKGYEKLEQMVNIFSIDHKLDIGNPEENISKDGYLSHLLTHRPCFLFNHANIGCQAPLVSKT